MEEIGRSVKKARTIRSEYNADVDSIQKWLEEVEVKTRDRITEPSRLKVNIQVFVEIILFIFYFVYFKFNNLR